MARPPARASGRSGLLSGGKSGKSKGFSLPSPKGHLPTPPARPSRWAGHEALVLEAAGQVGRSKKIAASTPAWRKRVRGKETLFPGGVSGQSPECSFPHFSREMGPRPGGPRSRPFQRRGPIPTTSPSPAQKQAGTPAEKHISLAPRRAIRYNRARNGQEAET